MELHRAAARGDITALHLELEADDIVDEVDEDTLTALHHAAAGGHAEAASLLLAAGHGVDVRSGGRYFKTPLHLAAEHGHVVAAGILLDAGADIETVAEGDPEADDISWYEITKEEWTPLQAAAARGQGAMVDFLLLRGAAVDASDTHDQTAVMLAAEAGHVGIVTALLRSGAQPGGSGGGFWPLLKIAVSNDDPILLNALGQAGAQWSEHSPLGKTLLHVAAQSGLASMCRLLLEAGAPVDCRDQIGKTPLHDAAFAFAGFGNEGQLSAARQLLSNAAEANARTIEGETPLHLAACRGNGDMARLLLAHGSDPAMTDSAGRSALSLLNSRHSIVPFHGNPEVAALLIDSGASCTEEDSAGRLPIHHAAENGVDGVVALLLERGSPVDPRDVAGWTPLHYAVQSCHATAVRVLADAGAEIDVPDFKGRTPLSYAGEENAGDADYLWDTVGVLLDRGARLSPDEKTILLQEAVSDGAPGALRRLLKQGARTDITDAEGRTPLHVAAEWGYYQCVRLLVQYGADVNAMTLAGLTPLALALASAQSSERVRVFLRTTGSLTS